MSPFQYAIVRVVPRVERGECMNVGVVFFCRPRRYLAARIALDEARLAAFAPELDVAEVRAHLDAMTRIAEGDEDAGPVARLDQSDRFHWLVAPSSTIIQPSPVCPTTPRRRWRGCWRSWWREGDRTRTALLDRSAPGLGSRGRAGQPRRLARAGRLHALRQRVHRSAGAGRFVAGARLGGRWT